MFQLRPLPGFCCLLLLASCSSPQSYLKKGNALFEQGKYAEAALNYRKAIQANAGLGEAHYQLGRTEMKLGDSVAAIRLLMNAVALMPDKDEPKITLGDYCLSGYVSVNPRPEHFYDTIARMSQGLLAKNPNSFDGLRFKGYISVFDGKPEEALESFRKANEVKPKQPPVVLAITQLLFQTGNAAKGEELANTFIAERKDFAPLYDALYSQMMSGNRDQEAESLLKQKIASNPKEAAFLIQLAGHYFREKNRPAMLATLQKLVDNPGDFPQARRQIGDFYIAVGDVDEARRQFGEGAKADAANRPLYQKRIVGLLIAQGSTAEALPIVNELVKAQPKDTFLRSVRGSLLLEGPSQAERDAALAEFESLIKEKPEVPTFHLDLGHAYLRKGRVDDAAAQFREAVRLRADFLPPRYALAEITRNRGDMSGLLRRSDEILAIRPGDTDARLFRAIALMGSQNLSQAETELTGLLQEKPEFEDASLQLGLLRIAQRRYREAEAIFRKHDHGDGKDLRPIQGMAELYFAQDQPDKALAVWQDALRKAPDSAAILLPVSEAAIRANRIDQALKYAQQLVAKQPDMVDAHILIGKIYQRKGDSNSAIASFQHGSKLLPNDPRPATLLAMALDDAGRKSEAIAAYRLTSQLQRDNPVVLNNLAFLLTETGGDLDEALQMAQEARRLKPDLPTLSDTVGWVYAKKNMQDNAIQIFNDLVRKYPDKATYSFHLGYSLLKKGDRAGAKSALTKALGSKPSQEEELKIRELIHTLG